MAVQLPILLPSSGVAMNAKVKVNFDFLLSLFNQFNTGSAVWDTVVAGKEKITNYLDMVAIANPPAPAAGIVRFHALTTQGFSRLEQDNEAATNITLGRDNVFIARNNSGSSISAGQPVYVTGSTGNVPNIGLAKADSTTTLPAVGVALDAIANNAFGQVMKLGIISGINTSAFAAGDSLWVSSTIAGALTKTRPGIPSLAQRIATVLVSGVGNGSLLVVTAPFVGGMDTGTVASSFTVPQLLSTNTTNQLVLGSTRTVTVTAPTPATSSRTHTILDVGANSNFVMSESSQQINGAFTISGTVGGSAFRTDASIEISRAYVAGNGALLSIFDALTPASINSESAMAMGAYDSSNNKRKTTSISSKWGNTDTTVGYGILRLNATSAGGTLDHVDYQQYGAGGIRLFQAANSSGPGNAIVDVAGLIQPTDDNARDLGTTSLSWRTLYLGTSIKSGSTVLATTTELGYLSGVTSAIQTQIDTKAAIAGQQFTGNISFDNNSTHGLVGTATNDNAASGNLGEYVESKVSAQTVSTSGVFFDVTSISLTAGDWDVEGHIEVARNGATFTGTDFEMFVGSTSGNSSTGRVLGSNSCTYIAAYPTTFTFVSLTISPTRVSLSGNTTYYLKGYVDVFTVGNPTVYGRISARRIR